MLMPKRMPKVNHQANKTVFLPSESQSLALAQKLACQAKAGDIVALSGEVGVGKSVLARAFIRHWMEDDALIVSSPTFNLVQIYEKHDISLWHCDCYRLSMMEEAFEFGLFDESKSRIILIEWPELMMTKLMQHPDSLLWLKLSILDEKAEGRSVEFAHIGANWQDRV